jgi:hypothetical protein
MTQTPLTLFQPEYCDFLYAAVREDGQEAPLSVLSALARLGVDPWDEAAALSKLSIAAANSRLATLLARVPNNHAAAGTSIANVARLLQLLPHQGQGTLTAAAPAARKRAILPIVAALLVSAAIVAALLTLRTGQDEAMPAGNLSGSSSTR